MTTTYDTDPNTQTVAAAWASSELGQPDREVRFGFTEPEPITATEDEPKSPARRAILAAGLASGVIAGAVLGVALFDFSDSSQPMVIERAPAPGHVVVIGSSTAAPAPTHVMPEQAPAVVAPAPQADAALPPAVSPGQGTVVVDVPKPEIPPTPEHPTPEDPADEPPNPVPPVPEDLDFKLPEPQPDPKPIPPVFVPDLPLAPAPKPDPKPQPPSLPDFGLQAPVKS